MQFDKKTLSSSWKYLIGIPLLAGGFLVLKSPSKPDDQIKQIETAVLIPETRQAPGVETTAAEPMVASTATKPTAAAPETASISEPVDPISREEQVQFRQQLDRFTDLQEIALKTKHEKERLKEWYRDDEMLRAASRFLSGTPEVRDESTVKMQQETTEFLIEAVKDGSELAVEAVLDILKSPNLENPAIAKEVRQLMAENQAELLYETVPTVPAIADFVRRQASPIQKAIYKNIHEIYQQNLAESKAELAQK